eukprot:TRINITY_DN13311_c0_g2_i1.p1 TRINITY_DN13311_c0_g2~~TRINITY_DN13311_c0_g2_i1.p1  ORF type:complete len:118 (+),score=23.50 TRINITY_DN13311_c0_g2_i1:49-354(+)
MQRKSHERSMIRNRLSEELRSEHPNVVETVQLISRVALDESLGRKCELEVFLAYLDKNAEFNDEHHLVLMTILDREAPHVFEVKSVLIHLVRPSFLVRCFQ